MNIYLILGIASGLVAVSSLYPYIKAIIRGESKPHPISWSLWAFMGIITLGTYWDLGARDTIWLALMNFIGPLTIAILSLKYWDWKVHFSVFDYLCLTLSIISILIWLDLHNPILALTFNLTADLIAALPTIRKVYKSPSSEDTKAWIILVLANILSIFAIRQWSYGVAVLPIYLCCLSLTVVLLSMRKFDIT